MVFPFSSNLFADIASLGGRGQRPASQSMLWALQKINEEPQFLSTSLVSEKSSFHTDGRVNTQSYHICSENPSQQHAPKLEQIQVPGKKTATFGRQTRCSMLIFRHYTSKVCAFPNLMLYRKKLWITIEIGEKAEFKLSKVPYYLSHYGSISRSFEMAEEAR